MARRSILACGLVALTLTAAPAAAATPRLGTPAVITSVNGEAHLLDASSSAGHPDAYAVFWQKIGRNVSSVVHRDRDGHAHRFDVRLPGDRSPEALRLVALEEGGGMALWDEGSTGRVLARAWTADGDEGPTRTVLSNVTTLNNVGFGSAQWRVRADGRGTVVVVSSGPRDGNPGSVVAAVRDPGGAFAAQQVLTPPSEPPAFDRQLSISPIVADGSVAVAWGPEWGAGPGGRALRSGRGAFGPAVPAPFAPEAQLSTEQRTILADDGAPITISSRIAELCPCIRPHVFSWPGGARTLAFQRLHDVYLGDWYVAQAAPSGVFRRAVRATEHASARPVRGRRPGEVGFARFDTETGYGVFRQRSRLIVMPFGPRVPRSRRAPRLGIGTTARPTRTRLLVPVWCDRVCTVRGRAGGRALPLRDGRGRRASARLEPFDVVYLRLRLPAGRRSGLVTVHATDDAGHHATTSASFTRRGRRGIWCRDDRRRC